MLHNAVVTLSGFHALATFEHVVTDRLLDIHVFAGLTGPDGDERVPVVAGSHAHRIEIFVFQRHANVLNTFRLPLRAVQALFAESAKQATVGIDQICHFDIGHGQEFIDMATSSPADADNPHPHGVVGTQDFAGSAGAGHREQGKHGAGRGGCFQKISACQSAHRQLLGHQRRVWGGHSVAGSQRWRGRLAAGRIVTRSLRHAKKQFTSDWPVSFVEQHQTPLVRSTSNRQAFVRDSRDSAHRCERPMPVAKAVAAARRRSRLSPTTISSRSDTEIDRCAAGIHRCLRVQAMR